MACNNCNQETTTQYHKCKPNPCQETNNCDCPIINLQTKCLVYEGEDLECSGILSGTILTEVIQQFDAFICEKIEDMINAFTLRNIGTGAEIYKGIDLLGRKELRKINAVGNLITVTQNINDISVSLDEDALNDFIEGNQKTYSIDNIGSGVEVYKAPDDIAGDNTEFNLRTLTSNTLSIQTSLDGNTIEIELIDTSGILQFIVNSDYTGLIEEGTIQKPFKNLQNAVNYFIGTGTNKVPQYSGATIRIAKDVNTFTGNLTVHNLNIIVEQGATLVCDPTYGDYVIDYDTDAILPPTYSVFSNTDTSNIKITVDRGGIIRLVKQGFKNRGTTYNSNLSRGKNILLLGEGAIYLEPEVSIASPSIRKIISGNEGNLPGYFNDANVAHFVVECQLITYNSQIMYVGLNSIIRDEMGSGSRLQFSDNITTQSNIDTIPIEINGGNIFFKDVELQCYGYLNTNQINRFISMTDNSTSVTMENCRFIGNVSNLFENLGVTQSLLILNRCQVSINIISKVFLSSSVTWTNVKSEFSDFDNTGTLASDVNLMPNTLNSFGSYLIETLSEYSSKEAAQTAGLPIGSAFVRRKNFIAGTFVVGIEYKINTIGTTDFTLIGASANTVGLYFTATGVGTGTGTADLIVRDIMI